MTENQTLAATLHTTHSKPKKENLMTTQTDPTTGQRVRIERLKRNWTQAQLASKLDPPVSQAAISDVENGVIIPNIEWILRAAKALDIFPRQLVPRNRQ